jgi:hypothetical protein
MGPADSVEPEALAGEALDHTPALLVQLDFSLCAAVAFNNRHPAEGLGSATSSVCKL